MSKTFVPKSRVYECKAQTVPDRRCGLSTALFTTGWARLAATPRNLWHFTGPNKTGRVVMKLSEGHLKVKGKVVWCPVTCLKNRWKQVRTFQPMLPNFRMSIVCRNVPSIRPFVVWYEPRVADKHAPLVEKKSTRRKVSPTGTSCTTNIWSLCGERLAGNWPPEPWHDLILY